MAFNIDNLIIDRITRITKQSISTGDVEWTANQIADGKLDCGGEEVIAKDGVGSTIASFDRTKTSKFSCTNSVLNLGVLADQLGTTKEIGTSTAKIVTKKVDILEPITASGATTLTLKYTPLATAPISAVWAMTQEGGLGQKYEVSASAATGNFTIAGRVITLGADMPVTDDNGDKVMYIAIYKCEIEDAVKITNSGDNYTKIGTFVCDALFSDVCDPATKYYGMVIFDRAKLANTFSLDLKPDGTQPIEFEGFTQYCGKEKNQFYIVIPKDDEEAA